MTDNTSTETKATKKRPSFIAYSVTNRKDKDANWRQIGAAFPHNDGNGFDILLDVTPLSGRITLRPRKQQQA